MPSRKTFASRFTAATAVFTVGMLTTSHHAHACDCAIDLGVVLPQDNTRALPQDVRLWLPGMFMSGDHLTFLSEHTRMPFEQELVLLDASATAIPFAATPIVDAHERLLYLMITPDYRLDAGRYELWHEPTRATPAGEPPGGGAAGPLAVAMVGEQSTTDRPSKPRIARRTEFVDEEWGVSSCGETRAIVVDLEHDGEFTLVAVNVEAHLEDEGRWRVTHMTTERSLIFGSMGCGRSAWNFDDGPARVQFAAMDLSGNVSEWTDVEPVYVEAGCGCAVPGQQRSGGTSMGSVAILVLGLVAMRRRGAVRRQRPGNCR